MKKILAAFVILGFSVMAYSQQIKPGGRLIVNNPLFLGTVFTGEATSNCAFNADFSELFLTADDYLLRVKLK